MGRFEVWKAANNLSLLRMKTTWCASEFSYGFFWQLTVCAYYFTVISYMDTFSHSNFM